MKTYSTKASLLVILLLLLSNNSFSQNNSEGDDRMKIRLGFTSSNNIHRQILVTVDSNTTPGVDFGYDAENFENHPDDMYWMIENRKFLIQGINAINATTTLPLGLHTATSGSNIISIEGLTNVPDDFEMGIFDSETNTYYDIIQTSSFSIELPAGEYLDRFVMKFSNNTEETSTSANETLNELEPDEHLDIDEVIENNDIELNYYNRIKSISIKNIGNQNIQSVKIYSISGQQITDFNNIQAVDKTLIKTNNLSAGNYILIVTTDLGRVNKKISVR